MQPVEIYLRTYLEKLDAQLADLPPERRAEIIAETREHLEAMMAARRADGMDENEAWHSARAAFGAADAIGNELSREWKRAPRVETVGAPLTRREKLKLFARPVMVSLVLFPFLMLVLTEKRGQHFWVNGLLALFSFGCMAFGVSRWRRGGGKWTPAMIFTYIVMFLTILQANLHLTFGTQWQGTLWDTFYRNSSFVMLPLFLISSIWIKRESKSTLPWRQMPSYAQNPIAAEETYRLSPKIGLMMGVTMGCLGNLWMSKFFGFPVSVLLCVVEVVLALLYARFVIDKSC